MRAGQQDDVTDSKIVVEIQLGLVIRGRFVPLYWTSNTEFADKKANFHWKLYILDQFFICEFADKKTADNEF